MRAASKLVQALYARFPSVSYIIVRLDDHYGEEVMVWLGLRLHCDLSPSAQGLSSSIYGSFLAVIAQGSSLMLHQVSTKSSES